LPDLDNRLEWSVFPMREHFGKAAAFWLIFGFVIWAVYWNVESIFLTVAAAIFLLVSLSSFYLPTNYELNSESVRLRRWFYIRQLEWKRVRSVVEDKNGLFLSTFPVRSRLENFRGLFLPYKNNRGQIVDFITALKPDLPGLPMKAAESIAN